MSNFSDAQRKTSKRKREDEISIAHTIDHDLILSYGHGIHVGRQWDDEETQGLTYIVNSTVSVRFDPHHDPRSPIHDYNERLEIQGDEEDSISSRGKVRRENQSGPSDRQSLFSYRHRTTMEAT